MPAPPILSYITTMPTPIQQPMTTPRRRMFAGAVVLAFLAVFFALPLYAAMTICTMPCCEHDSSSGQPAVSAGMQGCASECAIRSDEAATTDTVRTLIPDSRGTVITVPATTIVISASASAPPSFAFDGGRSPSSSSAPLHVLNSLFRI